MAAVRGKFKVTQITQHDWNPSGAQVKLEARYTGSAEDNTYSAATPTATIEMTITNPEAVAKLPLGQCFYVDFTPTEQ
jgi:hypothetical protein